MEHTMDTASMLAHRPAEDEGGFTLIELMVVVLIIAILIAIAIPTFLGARQRAQDRAAESDVRNGLTAEKTAYTDNQVFVTNAATMKAIEPSLDWGGKLAFVVGDAVSVGDQQTVCLSATSKSGNVFEIAAVDTGPNAGLWFGKSPTGCPVNDQTGANLKALGASW
jgi:type IV pilus assembly protein PilA